MDLEKLSCKKARNRQAAQKCRRLKRQKMVDLERKCDELGYELEYLRLENQSLHENNQSLQEENARLHEELSFLRMLELYAFPGPYVEQLSTIAGPLYTDTSTVKSELQDWTSTEPVYNDFILIPNNEFPSLHQ